MWEVVGVWRGWSLEGLKFENAGVCEGVEVLWEEGGGVRVIDGHQVWRVEKMCVRADVRAMCSFTNQSKIWRPRFINRRAVQKPTQLRWPLLTLTKNDNDTLR